LSLDGAARLGTSGIVAVLLMFAVWTFHGSTFLSPVFSRVGE
jgi:hypothetical protein